MSPALTTRPANPSFPEQDFTHVIYTSKHQ
jgi:hypothetical protein